MKRFVLVLLAMGVWYGVAVSEMQAQKKKPKAKPAAKPKDDSVDPPADRSELPLGAQDMLDNEVPRIREQQRREAEERRKAAREGREPNLPDPAKKEEKKEEKKDDGTVVTVGKPGPEGTKPAEPTETKPETPSKPDAKPTESYPPVGPPPANQKTGVVVRRGEDALRANAVSKPEPAVKAAVPGSVTVEVTVDENGHVVEAKAINGPPSLHKAAIETARKWTFKPVMFGNQPAKVIGSLTIQFK
jgi:TonB family protein